MLRGVKKGDGIAPVNWKLQAEAVAQVVHDMGCLPDQAVVEKVTVWGIVQAVVPLPC